MRSPIYWHPFIYRTIMNILYGNERKHINEIIIKEIGQFNVLDICCGDCQLAKQLDEKKYHGLDISPGFVRSAKRKGLNVELADANTAHFPKTECIVMQSSLYQFYPHHENILKKILSSATKKAIISEPIKNLSTSNNKLLKKLAILLTNPGTEYSGERLNENTIASLFQKYNVFEIKKTNREIIGIFVK